MKKITSISVVLLCCMLFFSACSGKKADTEDQKAAKLLPLTGIVVMPVVITQDALDKRVSGVSTPVSVVGLMNELISAELAASEQLHIVTESHLDALLVADVGGDRLSHMKTLGTKLNSNAILEVTVTRFHERDGSELAINRPASAAFAMVLTHIESGKVLWDASFDETQEALSANLLALGKAKSRGFKWITVEELVRQGLKERLAECPYLQK